MVRIMEFETRHPRSYSVRRGATRQLPDTVKLVDDCSSKRCGVTAY